MTTTISLEGLGSAGGNETRAIAYLKVTYNNQLYDWQVFVPENTSLDVFFATATPIIEGQIAKKELEWENLDPKTRTVKDPITGEDITVPINKEEIVRPDIPDYYALRRNEYPPLQEQLAAMWKGPSSDEYRAIQKKIQEVKNKYPKPYVLPAQESTYQNDLIENIVELTQLRLDEFAKTRDYDGILSACTYINSVDNKFRTEAEYCNQMRSATWNTLYSIMAQVKAGTRPIPNNFADIEPELPPLTWPN